MEAHARRNAELIARKRQLYYFSIYRYILRQPTWLPSSHDLSHSLISHLPLVSHIWSFVIRRDFLWTFEYFFPLFCLVLSQSVTAKPTFFFSPVADCCHDDLRKKITVAGGSLRSLFFGTVERRWMRSRLICQWCRVMLSHAISTANNTAQKYFCLLTFYVFPLNIFSVWGGKKWIKYLTMRCSRLCICGSISTRFGLDTKPHITTYSFVNKPTFLYNNKFFRCFLR